MGDLREGRRDCVGSLVWGLESPGENWKRDLEGQVMGKGSGKQRVLRAGLEGFGNGPRDCLGVSEVKPIGLGWVWRLER